MRTPKVKSLSRLRLFETLWPVAHQAPSSMGFSRQEYWSGLPYHSPGDLPDPGIKPGSPTLEADSFQSEPPGKRKGKVTQSCPTLCDPMGFRVHGILQARILVWGAFPFSRGPSQPRCQTQVYHTTILRILYQLSHKGSPRESLY